MDNKRIKQVSKISGVSEDLVKAVFTAELLRAAREFMKTDREYSVGIYGEIYPLSPEEYDVCQTKLSQEFIDIIQGNPNPELLESL